MSRSPGRTTEGSRKALYLLYSHYASDPRPRREAEALRDAGWEVTVYSLGRPGEPTRSEVEGVRVVALPTHRYRGESVLSYLWTYLRFLAWAGGRVVRHGGEYDLVHVHTPPDFLAFASLPARWRGAGTLLDIHDLTPELFDERFAGKRPFVTQCTKVSERWSTRVVNHVVTVNEQFRRRLIERGVPESKISVTLNLPEEKIFWRDEPPTPPEKPILAYHGTLVPHFGPQVLLEAAAVLVPEFPDLTVKILGDGDLKPDLLARAGRPDLANRVYISPDRVPVHRVPEELGAVSAGVVANRSEGFPRLVLPTKLLEYLAMGIPAVVTGTETIRYYFEPEEVVTFERPEPELVADALRPLLQNPDRAQEQVRKARRFFERHAWMRERQAYVQLAERLAR